ncbi:glutamine--fructose-6-phosphate transaminase (isomerizing) [Parasporobacterium paucivorans]|uniref:Glutamine--fructose-6-phosphate aminotransferase [isomerizing] n=1 Tax=Parasporobacterium paucivorans DSM 15970 TaxID=1122934 RepID=A0A1M6G434_9FIRM|nr:glutamine--fructose-6-phosphate transaminase (isomerizing) [Parasporobacterium paucivorans]SHJ04738.1 glutamine--fructose-6-phosphate transaminase [Parasporobacterium paucivorans DSM 15970]
MCGIVGYIGNRDCAQVLMDALSKLEYRGYDSAGIAVHENGGISVVKAKGNLQMLRDKLEKGGTPQGHCGIGHTRWATHGEPSDVNSHPHGNGKIEIVHNGIIENYREIKEFLLHKGYVFESETDTETVAKLLDYYYEGSPEDTIIKVLGLIRGSYALGMVFKDFPDRIFAVRKDSPLIIGVGENENFIASDVPAILKYTRDYYLIESDEIAEIKMGSIRIFDIRKEAVSKELHTATWDVDAAEKGGYEHFMLKEIHEQPVAIAKTIAGRFKDGIPDFSESGITAEMLGKYKRIYMVACGTAMHAGLVGKYLIEKLARVEVTVDIASEFRYRSPLIGEGDLVILISQSGETADTLAALKLSKKLGADTLSVVNVIGSSIARESDYVIYTHAGPEISVASTKAYSVQLTIMYMLAFQLAYVRGVIDADQCREYVRKFQEIPDEITALLEDKEQYQYIASKLMNADSLLYIGRGLDYATSMEGSLKLKEISYIHSESYAAGELKHGTISLITEGMPVIAIATQEDLLEKTISNVLEVKARGAMVVMLCKEKAQVASNVADYMIRLPDCEDFLAPMLTSIPIQLLAYYTAVLKGRDVDKPRNLAKSVTVE